MVPAALSISAPWIPRTYADGCAPSISLSWLEGVDTSGKVSIELAFLFSLASLSFLPFLSLFFLKFLFVYSFVFGCVRSSLLRTGFLYLR